MKAWKTTPISVSVHFEDQSAIYGESAIVVSVEDDSGGPFIKLASMDGRGASDEICLDIEQLQIVARVARELILAHEKAGA